MNDRIKKLRAQSLAAVNRISPERARLMTEFYKSEIARRESVPVMRALAFKYIMENKQIYIGEDELIVGERGPAPKATPTYPEICIHSLADLEILDSREKISFAVDEETGNLYKDEIIPFWQGKSMRDRLFAELPDDWKQAYEAGVFTEFQEQRAPGHTVLGDIIYRKGFLDLKKEIAESIAALDFYHDAEALDKREELKAMDIAADALINFARRHARALAAAAEIETNLKRKKELQKMAEICDQVPAHAPRTFHEALQYYWFVHVGVITELNPWDSFNPGRLDQHLFPYYEKERAAGTLSEEEARELLQAFWIKFNNHPAPPKIGVTARESNTYTDFALINVGGVKEDGSDAANEISYMILDVIEEMRILQPGSMVQVSKKSPDRLLKRALQIIKTGFGQPSIFNTDAIIQELTNQGKSLVDARKGGASGCVESGAFGVESYTLSGYFNLCKVLEITLYNGVDPLTGKKIGLETGQPTDFRTFDDLSAAYKRQLDYFIDIKIKGNNIISRLYARYMPVPFLSLLIDDCIKNGKDYNAGGARYNTNYLQGVGIGSLADSLTSLKYHIFDEKDITMERMMAALKANFAGHEDVRKTLIDHTPRYGNDDDYADSIARKVFDMFHGAVDGRPSSRGGVHRINLLPTTSHIYFGSKIGALPDGRKAHAPLSEGISPVQGADRCGPTSVIKSAAKIDHLKTGGTLLNQKFTPQLLNDEAGLDKLLYLIRSYFKLDGHHMQFNVIDARTLRKAQENPEEYRNLIVRVAGYSDYFVDLGRELQNEIIQRTEHRQF
ncbi:MAG: glycyl radical protein [Candidatus Aminicenantes bacterium]|nr:glycyl radical protein [Candidatus Aminicenantes bacterium]